MGPVELILKNSNIIKDAGTGSPGNDFSLNKPGFNLLYFLEGWPATNSFWRPCTHITHNLAVKNIVLSYGGLTFMFLTISRWG